MSKISKEQKLHLEGMEHALRIAKQDGIEALEKEVRFRSNNPLPLNVKRQELAAAARALQHDELMYVATSMAMTMVEDVKLPPSMITEFLHKFNDRINTYRFDPERYKADGEKLNRNYALNKVCQSFVEEDERDDK